jgi:hypothetical protein
MPLDFSFLLLNTEAEFYEGPLARRLFLECQNEFIGAISV